MPSTERAEGVVHTLSESEIQKRLYGTDLSGTTTRAHRSAAPAVPENSADSSWTGSEILLGEVQRLRSELVSIRKEKERLSAQLEHAQQRSPKVGSPIVTQQDSGLFAQWVGLAVLVGMLGYLTLTGARVLQASPAGMEAAPFTVQVAVYDVQPIAQRAVDFLRQLGYSPFTIETPRRNGLSRYRVYVGSFVTQEEARLEMNRLTADPRFQDFKDAFVRIR